LLNIGFLFSILIQEFTLRFFLPSIQQFSMEAHWIIFLTLTIIALMQIKFLGAAGNVTGSCFLIEGNGVKLLVDCGLYQERDFRNRNWDPFPFAPEEIDAVLLTHAHLDHCGRLPKLVREGFKGKIYGTAASMEIARIVLLDSAHIQEEDARFKRRRHKKEGRKGPFPVKPLYSMEDAQATIPLFHPVAYKQAVEIKNGFRATFREAGHILGSSMIELVIPGQGKDKTFIFSGDIGRWDKPIINDPTLFSKADYILMESTYGDRVHEDKADIDTLLSDIVNCTKNAGGNILIPSFALERTQELLYHLNSLLMEDRIPHIVTFVDSPMAVSVTGVFEKNPHLFDEKMRKLMEGKNSPFNFAGLHLVRSVSESKAINNLNGTVIIIAGSGMCTGGRIKHHLVRNIWRRESTVLFIGYQAKGTLGRKILENPKEVRILGKMREVKARINRINGFSAHADRNELMKWLSGFKAKPTRLFLVHGESRAIDSLKSHIREKTGWDVTVPSYKDSITLE
jgi:metallo-beta-lactamase family protein